MTWFICCICFLLTFQGVISYKAAVADFHPTEGDPQLNLPQFLQFISQAGEQGSDIIVFPEIGLNGYGECGEDMLLELPDPQLQFQVCGSTNYSTVLQELSCAAQKARIYVVVNLAEKVIEGGPLKYNTNVVFDRNGALIARYRKFNLFGEEGTNRTAVPELITFDTDFGVTFATFTCFDILYSTPALTLVREMGIRDIVFPTAWFSELPFLTAVQTQAMWAYSEDVNLLASGYNLPSVGSGGSGIYLGRRGAATVIFNEVPTSNILFAEVPKHVSAKGSVPNRNEYAFSDHPNITGPAHSSTPRFPTIDESVYLKQEHINLFNSSLIQQKDGDLEQTICYEEQCCHLTATITDAPKIPSYSYRLVAFNGVRSYDGEATGGESLCAVVLCANSSLSSCGFRQSSTTTFTKLSLSTTLTATSLRMPNTVLSNLMPLPPTNFSWLTLCDKDVCYVSLSTTVQVEDLLTFGIYARNFARDGLPESSPLK